MMKIYVTSVFVCCEDLILQSAKTDSPSISSKASCHEEDTEGAVRKQSALPIPSKGMNWKGETAAH